MEKKKEREPISAYELRLTDFIIENHPDKIDEVDFIRHKAKEAAMEFEESSKEGRSVQESLEAANRILIEGLKFSPYRTIKQIVEDDFFIEEREKDEFIMQMLEHTKDLFLQYDTNDYFEGSPDHSKLIFEIIGKIQIYLERNGLQ